jgi:2-keto-4-pentenoate hydratase/2-oxohepta-3-ene-1,7-dioic acid hydratase in catechol pathway
MKLVSFLRHGEAHYGVLVGQRVIDLSVRIGATYPDLRTLIAKDGAQLAASMAAQETGDYDYDELELLPVVPNPGKILCVGLNYHDHIDEADRSIANLTKPTLPMMFARGPESLTAHGRPIVRPSVSESLDWEAELLVVIGRDTGRHLEEKDALSAIFGYACMNEACVRDYQRHSSQITPGKNFERTGAIGPWLVTADEISDPMNLDVEMRLNGTVMQHANTKQMVHSIQAVIAYITRWTPLKPGDMIATGTMGGVGFARNPPIFMKPGDVAEVTIEKIGTLRNVIEDEVLPHRRAAA